MVELGLALFSICTTFKIFDLKSHCQRRDNAIAQIHPKAIQLRGLLQMRNRLATHFSKFTLDSFPGILFISLLSLYFQSLSNIPEVVLIVHIQHYAEHLPLAATKEAIAVLKEMRFFLTIQNIQRMYFQSENSSQIESIDENCIVLLDEPKAKSKNGNSENKENLLLLDESSLSNEGFLHLSTFKE